MASKNKRKQTFKEEYSRRWDFIKPSRKGETRGGGSSKNFVRVCVCRTLKMWPTSIPVFDSKTHPSVYQFWQKSTQLYSNWVLFEQISWNTPNFHKLGAFIWDENHPIAIPKSVKNHPQRQAHIRIPCQCEYPPRGRKPCKVYVVFRWFQHCCKWKIRHNTAHCNCLPVVRYKMYYNAANKDASYKMR